MRKSPPIPYRSDYTPPRWIDRHPDFTNPDPRLRPTLPLVKRDQQAGGYTVNSHNFPALYEQYIAMCIQAELDPIPELVITDKIPYAGRYHKNTIFLNLNTLNQRPWEQVLFMPLGHEIGHAWRDQNRDAADFPIPRQPNPRRQSEYEASMLAICMNNSIAPILSWMKNHSHGHTDQYPTNAELLDSIDRLPWSACPFPSGPVNLKAPPLLRAPTPKQK